MVIDRRRKLALGILVGIIINVSCINSQDTINIYSNASITELSSSITLNSTNHIARTNSPIVTSTVFPSYYRFPSWMSEPTTVILAALIVDEVAPSGKISFINANTGDKIDIALPKYVYGYFWEDAYHFGFLMRDLQTVYLLNILNGMVSMESVSSASVRLLMPPDDIPDLQLYREWGDIRALRIEKELDSSNTFFHSGERNLFYYPFSIKGTYTANIDYDLGQVVVNDITNDGLVWQSNSSDGIWDSEFAWSPSDDLILAVVSGIRDTSTVRKNKNVILRIIDVKSNRELAHYEGDIKQIQWSPDGSQILYLYPYKYGGHNIYGSPCILNVNNGNNKCFSSNNNNIPEKTTYISTGDVRWGIDNQTLFYIKEKRSTDSGEVSGDICFINLLEGSTSCPTEQLHDKPGLLFIYFDVSPDQEFLHFCYSISNTLSYYDKDAYDGIIRINGNGFISWIGITMPIGTPQHSCSYSTIWRPRIIS